jgi:hypothetical protein
MIPYREDYDNNKFNRRSAPKEQSTLGGDGADSDTGGGVRQEGKRKEADEKQGGRDHQIVLMAKKNHNKHARKGAEAKHRQGAEYNDPREGIVSAIHKSLHSGWVQNASIAFILTIVALVVAMATSTGVKAAAITLALVGTISLWIFAVSIIRHTSHETEFTGLLSPGNEPTPPNPCRDIPARAMLILLGNSGSYGTSFPQTIIKIGQDRMLTINKVNDRIAVNAKLFSKDGRIIAEIKNNEFFINPNNYFRKERPDEHSLVVYDQEGIEVLNVRFINPRTIKFLGVIRHPRKTVVVSERNGLFANTICTGEAGDAHFAFQ